ncbi:FixH family protein [Flavobacterium sp.]|uniref:FixH family protein n=1 Tax=Flavobacterium sp. TaxID=239 RepID=UPI002618DDD7|nr:FixH family protein [Flavobacterium sp.]
MKTNASRYVLLAFACFIAFILYFVVKVQIDSKYDHELMLEDYYRQEKKINKQFEEESAVSAAEEPIFRQTNVSLEIDFQAKSENISGTASFLRPSSQKADFTIPIQLKAGESLVIPRGKLQAGFWYITLEWQQNGKQLRIKKELYLK